MGVSRLVAPGAGPRTAKNPKENSTTRRVVASVIDMRFLIGLVLVVGVLIAQDTTGAGGILGSVSKPGVRVCVKGTTKCVTSDERGEFRMGQMRAGTYVLEVTAAGMSEPVQATVEVRAGLEGRVDILLDQSVTVTESVFVAPEEIKNSNYLVRAQEISKSAGALQDVSRYLQTLPGVAIGSNDFRNDIIVRGGSPLENLFVVDNVEIPNINNFANFASAGGTVSILDSELIRDVNFLTGGQPSPYINRLSGVLQVAQREGSRERIAGRATMGFAGAGAILEGPIKQGKGSWIVSARRSFLDLFTKDVGVGGVPVNYSFNTKAVYDLSAKDRIWAVNFTGIDNIRLGPTNEKKPDNELATLDIRYDGWRSATGFNWQRLMGDRTVGLLGVTFSEAKVGQQVKDLVRFGTTGTNVDDVIGKAPVTYREQNREGESTIKYDLTTYMPVLDKVQLGGSYKMFRIDYDAAQPLGVNSPYTVTRDVNRFAIREQFTARQSGAYVMTAKNLGSRVNLSWGGRFDNYSIISASRFSPRAGVSVRLTDKLAWKASYGSYYQQPFFLFLAAFPVNRGLSPIRADHYVTGFSYVASDTLRMTVETFAKNYASYPVAIGYPSLSLANTGDTFNISDLLFPMTSAGRGRVRGVEFFVEKKFTKKWFGQSNLSFSRTRHAGLDGVMRPGSFDYPFLFNAVGGYRLNSKWELSSRIAYFGGRPYTPFNVPVSTQQRRGVYDLTQINALRAPDYFRFDFRIDRTFTFRDKPVLVWLGLQNATNRKNFATASWDREKNVPRVNDQLGLFPLIGLDWRF